MRIYMREHLEGGAQTFGWQIIQAVRDLGLQPGSAFEWCSGFGTLGFTLLREGLCSRLVLGDINPEAIALCQRTIEINGLSTASAYVSDCMDSIPGSERFDLVIGNPPHFAEDVTGPIYGLPDGPIPAWHERVTHDRNWQAHRRFLQQIGSYLTPDGVVVLCETWAGATPETFAGLARNTGLETAWQDGQDGFFLMIFRKRQCD
jgi:methylase of polypeptide subunit release factors